MKPINEMNPTELLRYQVELLEKLVSDKQVIADFNLSFMKWLAIFMRVVPAIFCAIWAVALIAIVVIEVASVLLTGKIL